MFCAEHLEIHKSFNEMRHNKSECLSKECIITGEINGMGSKELASFIGHYSILKDIRICIHINR